MKKILVIDDEPQILWVASTRLQASGYAVSTALSGEQGLKKARQEVPDLVLLDHIMPEMNGDETLEQLKKDPATKNIPVIIFTADERRVHMGDYLSRGAADCLFKPFTPDELFSKIQRILGTEP
ncbi:MAG TPA: response regulator [Candidatus Omnitrophota bacterium]|nr:response regulator [Candidatus Omnitrophota bacterium]HRY86053.1 response regulator [Candidatus Omnitrophota bacterium]